MTTIEIRSVAEVPQQFLMGENVNHDVEFKLGRACVAHCAAAVENFFDNETAPTIESLTTFVLEHGAGSGSEFYTDGKGWNATAVADLLRLQGYQVVAQNLKRQTDEADFNAAVQNGRVRSGVEMSTMNLYRQYGGNARERWILPLASTIDRGGFAISTITIPLLSGMGFGGHSVVMTGIDTDAGMVEYFDPDFYNLSRLGTHTGTIEPHPSKPLHYTRALDEHLSVMTGEVMHVLPSVQVGNT